MSSPLPQPASSSIPINTKHRSPSVSSRRSSRSTQASGLKPWGTLSKKSAQSSSLSLVVAKGDMDSLPSGSAKERLPSVRRVSSVDVKPEAESVAEDAAAPLEPTPEPEPAAPAVAEPAPVPEPTPTTSAISPTPTPIPAPVAPQPTRSWFNTRSTLSTSPPQDTDNAQDIQIIANGIKAATEEPMTPGVDDVVPPLRISPPESSQQHQQQPSKSASASSLGMLSSRYSLALPLLGRPKVPLDAAMRDASKDKEETKLDVHAAAVHEGYLPPQDQRPVLTPTSTATAPAALSVPAPAPSPAQRAADTVSGSSTPLPTVTPPSEPAPDATPAVEDQPAPSTDDKLKPEDALPARSSSWWDLVWTPAPSAASMPASSSADAANANPATADEPTPADADTNQADPNQADPTPRQVKDLTISPPPPPATDPPPVISPQHPDAPQPELPEPPHTARSVQSATSGATAASAWYSPWTWYGAAGVAGAGSAPVITVGGEEAPKEDGVKNAEDGEGEALTAAEEIKREALARDVSLPTPTPSNPPPPTLEERSASAPPPSTSPIPSFTTNPIEKSLTANLGGWSTFFTSRALGAKRVKDEEERKEDGDGMEVVDVPDDVGAGVEVRLVASSGGEGGEKTVDEGEKEKEEQPTPSTDALKQDPARDKSLTRTGRDRATSKSSATSSKSKAPTPSRSGANSPNPRPGQPPNLVLPLFAETFGSPPRSLPLAEEQTKGKGKAGSPVRERAPSGSGTLAKAGRLLGSYWRQTGGSTLKGKGKAREASSPAPAQSPQESVEVRGEREREEERAVEELARRLPRTWSVAEGGGVSVSELAVGSGVGVVGGDVGEKDVLRGAKRAVVIGIHGWFPGTLIKSLAGEPTGTSAKFASMASAALEGFAERHGVTWEKVTSCPLEGEGRIGERVQRLYDSLTSNEEWMADLRSADVIFVACHSQGSIVSTHLLDRLLSDGHIHTSSSPVSAAEDAIKTLAEGNVPHKRKVQRIVCLALCGIHLGPLRYLGSSSLLQPYFQYLEGAAARELFEFQNTESAVSKEYVAALGRVLAAEVKMVYVASLNDQVVPIYSGIFTAASHPLILRALYIDGDAYHSTDFLTNLLVLLTRILNAGLPDSGLALHLSEATAGSLSGIGHSTAYEEAGVYDLAVDYLFLTNSGSPTTLPHPPLHVESFSATSEQNDYEIPWRLRDLIAHPLVARLFGPAFADLRDAFPHWHPRTAILRDVKRKLSPIQRLREGRGGGAFGMGSVGVGGVSRL